MSGADPHIRDGELVLRPERGFAYQADLTAHVYDDAYAAKFDAYEPEIEARVNAGRVEMLRRHLQPGASMLDFGAGSGAFVRAAIEAGFRAKGFEVIPAAAAALRLLGRYSEDHFDAFDAVTAWDVIEHLRKPQDFLSMCPRLIFVSLPIFEDLARIRESKHYRPGEHLFYWTDAGFVAFLSEHGFRLLERSSHEVEAGREAIGAYAFARG